MTWLQASKSFMERIERLRQLMRYKSLDYVFLMKPLSIFYFSGDYVTGVLYISYEDCILFVRRPKERVLLTELKVEYMDSFRDLKSCLGSLHGKAGLELDSIPYSLVMKLTEALELHEFENISHEIRLVRMVKDPLEVEKIRQAGAIAASTFLHVESIFAEGMSEQDLLIELDYFAKKLGNLGIYRMHSYGNEASFSHILQGEDALFSSYFDAPTGGPGISAAFPQGASKKVIEKSKPFTVDITINYDGYISDATRTFIFGKSDEHFMKVWAGLESVFAYLCELIVPGAIPEEIYLKVIKYVDSLGFSNVFMGRGRDRVKFIGHGTGLEVDEYPFIAKGFNLPIEENSILAIEPKFISEEFGIAGIEDTFLVTKNGPISLIPLGSHLVEL